MFNEYGFPRVLCLGSMHLSHVDPGAHSPSFFMNPHILPKGNIFLYHFLILLLRNPFCSNLMYPLFLSIVL